MTPARVLAHAHSTWSSDGRLSLAEWRDIAHARALRAVLFAEHEESGWSTERYAEYVAACAAASDADVTLVPGVEFSLSGHHVLCFGLRTWPARPSSAQALAQAVRPQGCVLCLAHPGRYRWTFPAHVLDVVDAIEVWNSSWVCDGSLGPHPRTVALAGDRQLFAGQDVHKRHHLGSLYLHVFGADPVAALRTGDFVVVQGGRPWPRERLLHVGVRGHAQRLRTEVVRMALQAYREARRLRRRLLPARPRVDVWAASTGAAPESTRHGRDR